MACALLIGIIPTLVIGHAWGPEIRGVLIKLALRGKPNCAAGNEGASTGGPASKLFPDWFPSGNEIFRKSPFDSDFSLRVMVSKGAPMNAAFSKFLNIDITPLVKPDGDLDGNGAEAVALLNTNTLDKMHRELMNAFALSPWDDWGNGARKPAPTSFHLLLVPICVRDAAPDESLEIGPAISASSGQNPNAATEANAAGSPEQIRDGFVPSSFSPVRSDAGGSESFGNLSISTGPLNSPLPKAPNHVVSSPVPIMTEAATWRKPVPNSMGNAGANPAGSSSGSIIASLSIGGSTVPDHGISKSGPSIITESSAGSVAPSGYLTLAISVQKSAGVSRNSFVATNASSSVKLAATGLAPTPDVEINSGGGNSFNTTPPTASDIPNWTTGWGSSSVTGWDYVGTVNGASGVYLGNGWVITAGHVGGGTFSVGGNSYSMVSGSSQSISSGSNEADITLFQITESPDLPSLKIATIAPVPFSKTRAGSSVAMLGYGGGAGESWGLNTVTAINIPASVESFVTNDFETALGTTTLTNGSSVTNTAYLVGGDSGGGDFIFNSASQTWMLSGINEAVDDSNNSYMVQLNTYASQINAIIAVPEPDSAGFLGLGALGLLCKFRRPGAVR
jgi:hypothetical protein